MNLNFDYLNFYPDNPPKVMIDTTVLCGAIRTDGICRKILQPDKPLKDFDQQDAHVWIAAIEEQCDYIDIKHKKISKSHPNS
jgi:ubiquitin-protein ligase